MGAGAGAIGDINGVGEPFERNGLAQEFLGIAGQRRHQLRGHDEVPLTEPFSERAGEGGSAAMFVHVFAAARALICFGGPYQIYPTAPLLSWTEKRCLVRQLPRNDRRQ